jgi:putative PIN family toxin of toxin-antitoxin system
MKVVLDSNVLLVAIGKRSPFRPIWEAFLNGRYQLVHSDEILYEYREVLSEHAAPNADAVALEILTKSLNTVRTKIYYRWFAITADPSDNKFFDAAVAANADYLVTNDNHFNGAKSLTFPKMNIVSANEFLQLLSNPE